MQASSVLLTLLLGLRRTLFRREYYFKLLSFTLTRQGLPASLKRRNL